MSRQIRYQLWIAAAAGLIFFTHLGAAGLWDMDEALYASCAREMHERNDLIVPWFNGRMFPEKPPLMFWTMIAGFELFGVNEFGARFFSAVLGVGTALLAFHLGRLLFNVRVGLWAGLITASTIVFAISARAATVDSALTFLTTAAMLLFVLGKRSGVRGQRSEIRGQRSEIRGRRPEAGGRRGRTENLPSPACGRGAGGEGGVNKSQTALTLTLSQRERGRGEYPQSPNLQISKSPNPKSQIPNQQIPHPPPPIPVSLSPLRWPYAALMYACIGLAVLAKGPVGMALPLAAIGLYVLIEGGWRRAFRSAWELRPLTGIVVIAAVAGPWYAMVGRETQGEWLRQFFFEFNMRPFRRPILGHGDAGSLQQFWAAAVSILYYFYHVPAVLVGFFPWSVFLGPTLIHAVKSLIHPAKKMPGSVSSGSATDGRGFMGDVSGSATDGRGFMGDASGNKTNSLFSTAHERPLPSPLSSLPSSPYPGCLLATCWIGVWFVFWSVCKTKLPHYLLPAYPALALLTAWWIEKKGSGVFVYRLKTPDPFITTIVVGLGIVVAVPIVAACYLPGEAAIGLVGLIPIVGGAWCWRESARGRNQQALGIFAIMSALFLTAMFGSAALRVDKHQNAKPMIAAIRDDCKMPHPPIAAYRFFRESTVYYSGGPVTRCEGDRDTALKQLTIFLAPGGRSYVIATDRQERELMEAFPGRLKAIFRHPRFLAPGDMVVFRCDGESAGSTKPDI